MSPAHSKPGAADGARRDWYALRVRQGDESVMNELRDAVMAVGPRSNPPTTAEVCMRLAELRALIREAEDGALNAPSWRPVARNPDLWELRWEWALSHVLVRCYFHEPPSHPSETVVAKAHVKDVSPAASAQINNLQDQHIDEAGRRVVAGTGWAWGLQASGPIYPRG